MAAFKSMPCGKWLFSSPKQHVTRTFYSFVGTAVMWHVLAAIAVLKPDNEKYNGGWTAGLVTYGALAELMGKPRRAGVTLTRQLGIIGKYCEENGLPALNAIVVSGRWGEPGEDVLLAQSDDVEVETKMVLEEAWFSIRPPTVNQLRGVYERHPELRLV